MKYRKYCVLNVVAQPHPDGIYRELFSTASSNAAANYRADHFARVSPVTGSKDGIFRGRLALWTELDPNEPTIHKDSFDQKLLSDSDISLPRDIGFNSKIFYFSFNEKSHRLYIELRNDEGGTISPGVARLALDAILKSAEIFQGVSVNVYIATTSAAVEKVLRTPIIRRIDIRLDLPNDDDLSDSEKKVLEKIKKRKIKRYEQSMTKLASAETLVLLPRDEDLAHLSKDNGYTKVWGKDVKGNKVEISTRDFPDIRTMELDDEGSSYRKLGSLAREDNEREI
ncbi:protein of unknown function [Loktanella atrilutea]|uniref:Uncharacterized protein n=1 Tax=Loktanella atrilutea TaxID=366533 RepID=A0A1M4T1K8_LOKAT|nr:DUF4747 family protein [Loktanella atrilutea]SHE38341.1 protein of unknown function [Loktanella atrilutea]